MVCLSAGNDREPCKNGRTDQDAVWVGTKSLDCRRPTAGKTSREAGSMNATQSGTSESNHCFNYYFGLNDAYYFSASTAVALDSSHMTASSSASWSRFSPPSNLVNGHAATMWFMVCHWPQSQEDDWARPHLYKLARHGP